MSRATAKETSKAGCVYVMLRYERFLGADKAELGRWQTVHIAAISIPR